MPGTTMPRRIFPYSPQAAAIALFVVAHGAVNPAYAADPEPADTAEAHFSRGVEAENQQDVKAARAAYERALALDAEHGRALVNLGLIDIREGKTKRGLERCEKALNRDPTASKVHYCLGLGAAQQNKPDEAAKALQHAIDLFDADPAPRLELAHIRRKQKRFEEAVTLYREAVRRRADDPDLHVHLGYCYKELKQFPAAEVEYRKAVQKDPESFYGNLNLGWVLVRQKKDDEAEPHYLKAVELDPASATPHFNLGNLYKRKGDLEKAKHHYEKSVELDPNAPDHHLELARMLWRLGDASRAKQHLDKALALKPDAQTAKAIDKLKQMVDKPAPRRARLDPKANKAAKDAKKDDGASGARTLPR